MLLHLKAEHYRPALLLDNPCIQPWALSLEPLHTPSAQLYHELIRAGDVMLIIRILEVCWNPCTYSSDGSCWCWSMLYSDGKSWTALMIVSRSAINNEPTRMRSLFHQFFPKSSKVQFQSVELDMPWNLRYHWLGHYEIKSELRKLLILSSAYTIQDSPCPCVIAFTVAVKVPYSLDGSPLVYVNPSTPEQTNFINSKEISSINVAGTSVAYPQKNRWTRT